MKFYDHRPSSTALLHPYIDITFKAMFTDSSPEAHEALRCFLTDIIGKEITAVTLIPNEPAGTRSDDKAIRFDVACIFNDGEEADIEMQGSNKDMVYGHRTEYLVARLLAQTVSRGDKYKSLRQVYQISVLNFIFDAQDDSAQDWYMLRKSNGHTLGGIMNVIFLELPKIKTLFDTPPEKLHPWQKWCIFIADAGSPEKQDYIRRIAASEGGIMQAQKVLEKISAQDYSWKRELDRDILAMDEAEKLGAAEERGIQQGKQETARSMKKAGIASDIIMRCTGLTAEQIAAI